MSIATYRGVKYDTKEFNTRQCQQKTVKEVYRGVQHEEKLRVCE